MPILFNVFEPKWRNSHGGKWNLPHLSLSVRMGILCELSEISSIFWVIETKHGLGTGHLLTEGRLDNYIHVNIHEVSVLHIQIGHCPAPPLCKFWTHRGSDSTSPRYYSNEVAGACLARLVTHFRSYWQQVCVCACSVMSDSLQPHRL